MFYRPEDGVAADVIPYYENGTYYLFYLKDYRDFARHGEGCPWHLLTTNDLVNYEDHGIVLERGSFSEQDLYVFTGSVFRGKDQYYIFYTGHNPHFPYEGKPQEKILLAASDDLLHWKKVKDFSLSAPEWYDPHDFRDPFVYFDEGRGVYRMLLAARTKIGPADRNGVTAVAESDDLLHWQVLREPFYAPGSYFTHECPDFFRLGDWYYLIFSEFSDKIATRYRMSRSPDGPWITPANDTFDGHCFYAAKTCENGDGKRIAFGWNCIRNEEKDDGIWQWGGTIIPHELVQNADGTLSVRCPAAVAAAYAQSFEYREEMRFGTCVCGDKIRLGDPNASSLILFSEMPDNCKITARIRLERSGKDFGLLLRSDAAAEKYYKVKIEPAYHRMAMDRTPRTLSFRHCEVETERRLTVHEGDTLDFTVIVEGSVLEVYVGGVAMSARMFDFPQGRFGFYAEHCVITVSDIALYRK